MSKNLLGPFLGLFCAACASAPEFRPSTPLEEARTVQESLLLCHEYEMPVPANRPVALRPYLDCVETSVRIHSPVASRALAVFVEEFRLQYGLLRESQWSARLGVEVETAIRAVLRALWRRSLRLGEHFTERQKDAVLRHFPRTASGLDVADWKTASSDGPLDPRLEKLKAGVSGLIEAHERPGPRLERLLAGVDYLTALWKDRWDVTQIDAANPAIEWLERTYRSRLAAVERELEELRGGN